MKAVTVHSSKKTHNNSSDAKSLDYHKLLKNQKREIRRSHITAINGTPIFEKDLALEEFKKL